MEWTEILGSVASAGSGGILGIAGSLVSGFFKSKKQKSDREFQEKQWQHEIEVHKVQQETRKQETEDEMSLIALQGSQSGLVESIKADSSIGSTHPIINGIKALYRPFLTTALWILAYLIFRSIVNNDLEDIITKLEAKELIRYMVYTVFFCASTATMWWFGDRALSPPSMTK
jgi:hypothetical protein